MLPVIRMSNKTSVFKQNSHFFNFFFTETFLIIGPLLSGLLIGTSYIPLPAWAVGFCYLPLWWAVLQSFEKNKSGWFIFFQGWLTQFVLSIIGFNWIYYAASEFGHLHWSLSLSALLLFATFMHVYIPFVYSTTFFLKKKVVLSTTELLLLFAFFHILFERVWPSIFEWHLGYTFLWMKWPLFQLSEFVGFKGLSALIFIFQSFLLIIILRKKFILLPLLILAPLGFHFWGISLQNKAKALYNSSVNVMLVQANISNEEKLRSELGSQYYSSVMNSYFNQTQKGLTNPNPDLLIWPETAMPLALDQIYHLRPFQSQLINQIKIWNTTLITGGYSQDPLKKDPFGQAVIRNSVFFLGPQGELNTPYYKTDLLAFGEYMPFGETFPLLYKLLPFVGTYERGPGATLKTVATSTGLNLKLGPQICYESLNDGFSRLLAQQGAELFFNLTNDSWFGTWAEPYQHLIMTLARGVENRRPLIRSTNTGISTVVLADGEILEYSPQNKAWSQIYSVNYQKNAPLTFYNRYGHLDWLIYSLFILVIVAKNVRKKMPSKSKD